MVHIKLSVASILAAAAIVHIAAALPLPAGPPPIEDPNSTPHQAQTPHPPIGFNQPQGKYRFEATSSESPPHQLNPSLPNIPQLPGPSSHPVNPASSSISSTGQNYPPPSLTVSYWLPELGQFNGNSPSRKRKRTNSDAGHDTQPVANGPRLPEVSHSSNHSSAGSSSTLTPIDPSTSSAKTEKRNTVTNVDGTRMELYHPIEGQDYIIDRKRYVCKVGVEGRVCDKSFPTKANDGKDLSKSRIHRHVRSHMPGSYNCPKCDKIFHRKVEATSHSNKCKRPPGPSGGEGSSHPRPSGC